MTCTCRNPRFLVRPFGHCILISLYSYHATTEYFSSPDKEDLRALALATANNWTGDYLLSGGYDRVVKCYSVTEALRGAEPIETYSSHQFEVISSVQWRPGEIWEFSYTTDDGTFMLMDRRMRQPAKLVQGFQNSYSHTYISPNGVAVGTGQGMIAFFDLRASNR
jgi:WD40 repeat protein